MSTPKGIVYLYRARQGILHALAILDAAGRLPVSDIADRDILIDAARDLLGHHLEEIDSNLDALDELTPLGKAEGMSLHALGQIGSARTRGLANHLSAIVEARHA